MRKTRLTFKAAELFGGGTVDRLRLGRRHKGLMLDDSVLVEDDAPGGGFEAVSLTVTGDIRIKKELFAEQVPVHEAWVLVYAAAVSGSGAGSVLELNGHRSETVLRQGWNYIPAEAGHIIKGINTVILEACGPAFFDAGAAPRGGIIENDPARLNLPQRSYFSGDGGSTWQDGPGPGDGQSGEYMIRLRLGQSVPSGIYTSPVIDLADPGGHEGVKGLVSVEGFAPKISGEQPPGTELAFFYRTGTEPAVRTETWDPWRECRQEQWCRVRGRWFQGKILFKTSDPLVTPVVKAVSLNCGITRLVTGGGGMIKAEEAPVPALPVSSMAFRYEQAGHRHLASLYRQADLGAVIREADTAYQKLLALTSWTAAQPGCAVYGGNGPGWNSLEILSRTGEGEPRAGCSCQFSAVFVQAVLACGLQARVVMGSFSGYLPLHHMAEAWCDDYGKWILLDPVLDCHYLDAGTLVPLSALELYSRLTAKAGGRKKNVTSLTITPEAAAEALRERGIVIRDGGGGHAGFRELLYRTARTGSLRWLPRNNFFSETYPIPKVARIPADSGWNGWWHWDDEKAPWEMQFDRFSARADDFYPVLNRVCLTAAATERPGELRVFMQTVSPDLDTFLVSSGDGPWEPSGAAAGWTLREGPNRFRARVRGTSGTEYPLSEIRANYTG